MKKNLTNITDIIYKIEQELDYIDEATCNLATSENDENIEDLRKAHREIAECCEALAEICDALGEKL